MDREPTELETLCEKLKITAESRYGVDRDPLPGVHDGMDAWTVTLRFGRRRLTVPFFMGVGHNGAEPDAASVLYCLASDARAGAVSFEDFASEFGYDPDSRKAEQIWKACRRLAPRVRQFLGDAFEDVANAEH